jgi:RNA polymerase sigma factor (TIGR02999 family)
VRLVYDELRRLARAQLRRLRPGDTLDTTALVHEAYLKLAERTALGPEQRSHFLSLAARAMRQILVDYARRRAALKRGDGRATLPLLATDLAAPASLEAERLLALDQALERLGHSDEQLVRIVECRFFLGLGDQDTAQALGVSTRTVERRWARARAFLRGQLESR